MSLDKTRHILSWLSKKYILSYSQYGEDIILYKFLSNIKNGRYIDVGCADPVSMSVSWLFYKLGWRGINIDPRRQPILAHDKIRPQDQNLCLGVSNKPGVVKFWECGALSTADEETVIRIGVEKFNPPVMVEMVPLSELLDRLAIAGPVHFLKIDVERHERYVLEGLDLNRHRPWIIVVEATLPGSRIPDWVNWETRLLNNGYRFALMDNINRFYITEDKYDELQLNFQQNYMLRYMEADKFGEIKCLLESKNLETESNSSKTKPPVHAPKNLMPYYTLDSRIPYKERYYDNTVSQPGISTENDYNYVFNAMREETWQYYGETYSYIKNALQDFPINDKTSLVIGLTAVNCDAISLVHGAKKVFAIDYNPRICRHPFVESMGIKDFESKKIKADVAFSISSYDHDGLGRYGDPLCPDADIKSMKKLKKFVKTDGILFLAVETGPDFIVFNAHRIYGRLRFPMLIGDWNFLASYGMTKDIFDTKPGECGRLPVLVLSNNQKALNIPESASEMQKMAINNINEHGAFDRKYYLQMYPDILTGQMDAISHYVIHGAVEGRNPNAWFNTKEYMEKHSYIDFNNINPFLHSLKPWLF